MEMGRGFKHFLRAESLLLDQHFFYLLTLSLKLPSMKTILFTQIVITRPTHDILSNLGFYLNFENESVFV